MTPRQNILDRSEAGMFFSNSRPFFDCNTQTRGKARGGGT